MSDLILLALIGCTLFGALCGALLEATSWRTERRQLRRELARLRRLVSADSDAGSYVSELRLLRRP